MFRRGGRLEPGAYVSPAGKLTAVPLLVPGSASQKYSAETSRLVASVIGNAAGTGTSVVASSTWTGSQFVSLRPRPSVALMANRCKPVLSCEMGTLSRFVMKVSPGTTAILVAGL